MHVPMNEESAEAEVVGESELEVEEGQLLLDQLKEDVVFGR